MVFERERSKASGSTPRLGEEKSAGLGVTFVVHGVSTIPQKATVEFNGEPLVASVDCLEVEFVTEDSNMHGSLTLRFVGAEAALARAKFVKDSKHTWVM